MDETALLEVDGQTVELPLVTGGEGERAVDIRNLRSETGLITLDPGYKNRGSCQSAIPVIDGDQGLLRYRGIPDEDLKRLLGPFPKDAHPMAVCAAVVAPLSTFYPEDLDPVDPKQICASIERLIAKFPTIAAWS